MLSSCMVSVCMRFAEKKSQYPLGLLASNYLICSIMAMIYCDQFQFSLGLGAFGLPGDFSSASRFVRATYVKSKSVVKESEKENVNQFFHILRSVAMPLGCVLAKNGEFEYTRYSSCCNTNKQIYYYTTYYNSSITSIHMHDVDLDSQNLFIYDLNE